MKTIEEHWQEFSTDFKISEAQGIKLFAEIQSKYKHKSRAYHNLLHIKTMLDLADKYLPQLEEPRLLRCSIWYHDLIYNAFRKDNELKSADRAKGILQSLNVSSEDINKCHHQIMLTKAHRTESSDGIDEKMLIDFDLEILSRNWEEYELYTQQIRKEYWMYPGPIYRKGRRVAMEHFLEREFIYQTELFRKKNEEKARMNIKKEISLLGA